MWRPQRTEAFHECCRSAGFQIVVVPHKHIHRTHGEAAASSAPLDASVCVCICAAQGERPEVTASRTLRYAGLFHSPRRKLERERATALRGSSGSIPSSIPCSNFSHETLFSHATRRAPCVASISNFYRVHQCHLVETRRSVTSSSPSAPPLE